MKVFSLFLATACVSFALAKGPRFDDYTRGVHVGPRPYWLVKEMDTSDFKSKLEECAANPAPLNRSDFSIGHRGACLQYPEHTIESYTAALDQGAGIVECDVTFTKDLKLVCRHAQCDLHTTTDVVTDPALNAKCTIPWSPGVTPKCCTSDFTLREIKKLCAKMDSSGPNNLTAAAYAFGGTADWRTDLYQSGCPRVPTHTQSLKLINGARAKFTPELKTPEVKMPYLGTYTQEDFAQQLVDEYVAAGIDPSRVWLQSFLPSDVYYWIKNTDYGDQAVSLDGNDLHTEAETLALLDELVKNKVKIVAPPLPRLVVADSKSEYGVKPSAYAKAAKARGLDIITWTLERSPPGLTGYYYSSTEGKGVFTNDGDMYKLLYVLAFEVGVLGVFSDWPATTTFFANCFDIKIQGGRSMNPVQEVTLDTRPFWLVNELEESPLKTKLTEFKNTAKGYNVTDWSIGHRGSCLQFPEHTIESYEAAIKMGSGIVECDVTFTKDRKLVCRHDQCDLHTTTDVVLKPALNAKCTKPWAPGVAPVCCTSDFTLAEIETLCAKMDSSGPASSTTALQYAYGGTANWRTDIHQYGCHKVPTHEESIVLMKKYGVKFTPELKFPVVTMPFQGDYTQEDYAQQMIDEYIDNDVPPEHVWPQSFNTPDVYYWVKKTDYGDQAVALDGNDLHTPAQTLDFLNDLVKNKVKIVAPPMQRLVTAVNGTGARVVPSRYAIAAKRRGLDIITWTLERSPPGLTGYYYSTSERRGVFTNDGDLFHLLYTLAFDVKILGIFSDWPATTTFFANAFGLKLRTRAEY